MSALEPAHSPIADAEFPLFIGLPFLTAFLLKRIGDDNPSYMKVSALWLAGIYTYIFGSLICCLLSALYVVFVEPAFVASYMQMAIDTISRSPEAGQYAASVEVMRKAIDSHLAPSGLEFVSAMAWSTSFLGSFISLFVAWFLTRNKRKIMTDA